jgi:hypothetical protein
VHEIFTKAIHAHTAQLYSCAESHEVGLGLKVCRGERGEGGEGARGGDALGRDDGVCSLYQELAKHSATYASPIKSKGRSDEEPAGAPGLRFLPLASSSLGMGPRHCTANCCCCCYCGGGLGGGFGGKREISRTSKRRCGSPRSKLASQPFKRVGNKGPPIWCMHLEILRWLVKDTRLTFLLMQFTRFNTTRLHGQNKNERRGKARYFAQRFS